MHGTVRRDGDLFHVFSNGEHHTLAYNDPMAHAGELEAAGGRLTAPMPGKVVAVLVEAGQEVKKGDPLVIMEAMKMEHTIAAPSRRAGGRSAVRGRRPGGRWRAAAGLQGGVMRILLYRGDGEIGHWAEDLARALPGVQTLGWQEGETLAPCDYAVLWNPAPSLLPQLAQVKAVFLMGAGADAILKFGDALPNVPIVRLGDAGMAVQMAEYVAYATLRYFRRFDEYEEQARHGLWAPLPVYAKEAFTIGVMGLGKLGLRVVETMRSFGFPVRGWSRTPKELPGRGLLRRHGSAR